MNTPTNASFFVLALMTASTLAGCGSNDDFRCPDGEVCDSSTLAKGPHGLRSDGTVDITVEQAWPDRKTEPPPLTADEMARACSVLAACTPIDVTDPQDVVDTRRTLLGWCLYPELSMFWEERAVPGNDVNERWTFEARAILGAGGDCAVINALHTPRPKEIVCEEAGCWWSSFDMPIPTTSCDGSVATLTSGETTYQRDCSRALQDCDVSSPTGCSDRRPVRCEHPAKDRCDGAIRLGCDGNGRVSFHDCARIPGGTCAQTADGIKCVSPDAGECDMPSIECDGSGMAVCMQGKKLAIDCEALGLAACADGICAAR